MQRQKKEKTVFLVVCEIWNADKTLNRRFTIDRNSQDGKIEMAKAAKWAHLNNKIFVTTSKQTYTACATD